MPKRLYNTGNVSYPFVPKTDRNEQNDNNPLSRMVVCHDRNQIPPIRHLQKRISKTICETSIVDRGVRRTTVQRNQRIS